MKRGEIWGAVWPSDPMKKERPVLIVSNNFRNNTPGLRDLIVLKITSLKRADGSKKNVNKFEDLLVTLKKESIIQSGAIFSIEKTCLTRFLGQLGSSQMREVNERLLNVLDLA